VRKTPMEEVFDQERTDDDLWYREFVPNVSTRLRRRLWSWQDLGSFPFKGRIATRCKRGSHMYVHWYE
jgi:hypothetical protein